MTTRRLPAASGASRMSDAPSRTATSALFGIVGGNPVPIDVTWGRSDHQAARTTVPTTIANPPLSRGQDRSSVCSRTARSGFPAGNSWWGSALPLSRGSTNLMLKGIKGTLGTEARDVPEAAAGFWRKFVQVILSDIVRPCPTWETHALVSGVRP